MSAKQKFQENFASDSSEFNERLEPLDRKQIEIWRNMGPIKRLEMAFQAYQFALDAVRLTEQQNHPDLSAEEFNWRIVQRMQGISKKNCQDLRKTILSKNPEGSSSDELQITASLTIDDLSHALRMLERHDVILKQNDHWRFTVELMRRWVKEKGSI